jgi:general secretion pathway protein M
MMSPLVFGLSTRQVVAIVVYVGAVGALALGSLQAIDYGWTELDESATIQEHLDGLAKRPPTESAPSASDVTATGPPFLDGQTITIAGAVLQQRVQQAVAKAGGILSSSQVDLDGPEAAKGFVYLTATTETSQPAIQTILYDVEAGMPYLFIDKLSIQPPMDLSGQDTGKMRMTIRVGGQWRPSE